MKHSLIIILFILGSISHQCTAQEKKVVKIKQNNIHFQADRFYFTNATDTRYFNKLPAFAGTRGITYKRLLSPEWNVRIGYHSLWNTGISKRAKTFETSLADTPNSIGKLFSRSKFQFAEIEVGYTKKWRQHSLTIGAGPSFTQTKNDYITKLIIYYDVVILDTKSKTEQYLGAVFGLHYDFQFWKDRISVGADFKLRMYQNIPFMYDVYGLHAGYNF